jgi:hypothetical protein
MVVRPSPMCDASTRAAPQGRRRSDVTDRNPCGKRDVSTSDMRVALAFPYVRSLNDGRGMLNGCSSTQITAEELSTGPTLNRCARPLIGMRGVMVSAARTNSTRHRFPATTPIPTAGYPIAGPLRGSVPSPSSTMAHNPKIKAVNITAPLNDGDDSSSARRSTIQDRHLGNRPHRWCGIHVQYVFFGQ